MAANDSTSSPMPPPSPTQIDEKSETKQQQLVVDSDSSSTATDVSNLPPRSTNSDALPPPPHAVVSTRALPLTPADFSENIAWDVVVDVYPRAYMQMQMLNEQVAALPQSKAVEEARQRRDQQVEDARLRWARAEEEGARDVAEQQKILEAVSDYQLMRKTERLYARCRDALAGACHASTARPPAGTSGTVPSLSVAQNGTSSASSTHSAAPRATEPPSVHPPDGHAAVTTPHRLLSPPTETKRAQVMQPRTPVKPRENKTETDEDRDEEEQEARPEEDVKGSDAGDTFKGVHEARSLAERHRLHHVVEYIRKSKNNLRVCVYHKKDRRTGLCGKEPQNCLPWDSGRATLADLRELDQAMSERQSSQSESKAQSDSSGAAEKRHHDVISESDDDDDVDKVQRPAGSKQQKTASSSTPGTARSGRPSSGPK